MWGRKAKKSVEEAIIVPETSVHKHEVRETLAKRPSPSVIGKEAWVTGSINSSSDLAIEGTIDGDVRCALLTVGSEGVVNGDVIAETATIRGKIKGNVRARTVLLAGTGSIEGDLTHSVLIIEEGGTFEGHSRRKADPLSVDSNALAAPEKIKKPKKATETEPKTEIKNDAPLLNTTEEIKAAETVEGEKSNKSDLAKALASAFS